MAGERWSQVAVVLAQQAGSGASAARIADTVLAAWHGIEQSLRPIIGRGGVAALYKRSLQMTLPAHPWLASAADEAHTPVDFSSLRTALVQRSEVDAAAAGAAVLQTFHDLLAALVGAALTERLLRTVWPDPSNSPPGQDMST